MNPTPLNWTKEDLKIYLLIYCANADFSESKVETEFIKSKIQTSNYEKIHGEFDSDNDYQSIQKIQRSIQEHGYKAEDMDRIFQEIKKLLLSDGNYDILERNLYKALKKILN